MNQITPTDKNPKLVLDHGKQQTFYESSPTKNYSS